MKKDLSEVFDALSPEETGALLSFLPEPPEEAGDEELKARVLSALPEKSANGKRSAPRRRIVWLVAAVVLLFTLLGACAAKEVHDVNEAVKFFDEKGLDRSGLSNGDLKRVYRDITSKRFALPETRSLLAGNEQSGVPGVEIREGEIVNRPNWSNVISNFAGVGQDEYVFDTALGYVFSSSLWGIPEGEDAYSGTKISAIDDGKTTKETLIPIYANGKWALLCDEYLTVFGHNPYTEDIEENERGLPGVVRLTRDLQILWQTSFGRAGRYEDFVCLAELPSSGGVLLVTNDLYRGVRGKARVFDKNGNLTAEYTGKDRVYFGAAWVLPGERVLLTCVDGKDSEALPTDFTDTFFLELDENLKELSSFSLRETDTAYIFKDVLELGDALYLSGYALPVGLLGEEGFVSEAQLLNVLRASSSEMPGSGTLLAEAKAVYTAVLMAYSPGENEVKKFYTVPGAEGGALSTDEKGRLVWTVEMLENVKDLPPWSDTFAHDYMYRRYAYLFGKDGRLLQRTDTGEDFTRRK